MTKDEVLKRELVAWRNAALRVGEDLCSVGPFGYYDMTAEQWLDWALSVVTVHAPPAAPVQEAIVPKPWVNLTIDELLDLEGKHRSHEDLSAAIKAKLKEKNQ